MPDHFVALQEKATFGGPLGRSRDMKAVLRRFERSRVNLIHEWPLCRLTCFSVFVRWLWVMSRFRSAVFLRLLAMLRTCPRAEPTQETEKLHLCGTYLNRCWRKR
jgi:hypothetical protein